MPTQRARFRVIVDGATKISVSVAVIVAAKEGLNFSGSDITVIVEINRISGIRFRNNDQVQLLERRPQNRRDRSIRASLLSINSSRPSSASNASP